MQPICLPRSHVYLDTLELQPNSWPRYFVKYQQAPAHPVPSPKLLSRPIIEPSPISSLVPQSRPISSSLPRISTHLELRPARSTPTHPSAHPSSPHLSRFQPSLVGNIKRERTFVSHYGHLNRRRYALICSSGSPLSACWTASVPQQQRDHCAPRPKPLPKPKPSRAFSPTPPATRGDPAAAFLTQLEDARPHPRLCLPAAMDVAVHGVYDDGARTHAHTHTRARAIAPSRHHAMQHATHTAFSVRCRFQTILGRSSQPLLVTG